MNASNWAGRASIPEAIKIIESHLKAESQGKPYSNEWVLTQLKPLYVKLEDAGLMPLTFNEFENIAMGEYMKAEFL